MDGGLNRFWGLAVFLGLAMLAGAAAAGKDFRTVSGPCGFVFPADHADHPEYRTEWWYYTGRLTAAGGQRFGFQLTFFRHRIAPPADRAGWPQRPSAWRSDQVYLAHAAVTDIGGGRHLSAERSARGALDMAGTAVQGDTVTVHLGPWSARIATEGHRLAAAAEDFAFVLDLTPLKPPTAHGQNGYSRKGTGPERASCYYSLTRLSARGEVVVGGRRQAVDGLAWMDHEYSTAPLEPGLAGWDWFSLQLDDGTDLMCFGLRMPGGTWHPASGGTLVAADGTVRHLARNAIRLSVTRRWQSPHSGADYPAGWRLHVAAADLDLKIRPVLDDQEMRTGRSTGVTYWEGVVDIAGRRGGRTVNGGGYVELTGYAGAFDAPL